MDLWPEGKRSELILLLPWVHMTLSFTKAIYRHYFFWSRTQAHEADWMDIWKPCFFFPSELGESWTNTKWNSQVPPSSSLFVVPFTDARTEFLRAARLGKVSTWVSVQPSSSDSGVFVLCMMLSPSVDSSYMHDETKHSFLASSTAFFALRLTCCALEDSALATPMRTCHQYPLS